MYFAGDLNERFERETASLAEQLVNVTVIGNDNGESLS